MRTFERDDAPTGLVGFEESGDCKRAVSIGVPCRTRKSPPKCHWGS